MKSVGASVAALPTLEWKSATAHSASDDELARIDAIETARLIKKKDITPTEAVEAAIARIEAINPELNAVIETWFEKALEAAASNLPIAPFRGVPILVKDVFAAGDKNYMGSRALAKADFRASETSAGYDRIKQSGMIMLGRTNVPEFYSAATTESRLHGPCLNPWETSHSVGGSSGGSGAAVAAGLVAAAQASDGGGSTRVPASANGLVGLKPSRGRTSLGPSRTDWMDIMSTSGWLTRSVRDTAALMDVLSGPWVGDSLVARNTSISLLTAMKKKPKKLRIGLVKSLPHGLPNFDPEAVKAVELTASLLASLGHEVDESAPAEYTTTEHFELYRRYLPIKVATRIGALETQLGRAITEDELEPGTFRMLSYAKEHSMFEFADTLKKILDYSRRIFAWHESGFDLLLTPTTGTSAPKIGVLSGGPSPEVVKWGALAPISNLTGQPAISVPLHMTKSGMPLGSQLIALPGQDALLVQVAAQLESAAPWTERRPDVHA